MIDCPRFRNPCASSIFGEFHFLIFSLPLSGVIRIGFHSMNGEKLENSQGKIRSTVCKWSSLNSLGTETPVPPFLVNSLFSFSGPSLSGVIGIGPLNMNGGKLENFQDKISTTGYKLSSLNAPVKETPVSHTCIKCISFFHILPSSFWGNKNWTPQYEW